MKARLAFAAVMLIAPAGCSGSSLVVPAVRDYCLGHFSQMRELAEAGKQAGLCAPSSTRHQVDEVSWAAMTHDQKRTFAIALFCGEMKKDGTGVVILYGLHDGKQKASVVDGNYSDA